jgi:hypothetical protein
MEYFSIVLPQLSSVLNLNIDSETPPRTRKLTFEGSKVYFVVAKSSSIRNLHDSASKCHMTSTRKLALSSF